MSAPSTDYSNWDLTTYFPEFLGSDYTAFKKAIEGDVDAMLTRTSELPALTTDTVDVFARLLEDLEALTSRVGHISSYLGCLQADDATNEDVGREYASIGALWSKYGKAYARVESAFKLASDEAFEALVAHDAMKDGEFSLRRTREAAMKTMDVELEELASDLLVNGFNAWGRLYNKVAGKLEFDMEQPDGSTKRVPFALKRSLTENPDPFTRRAALEGSNKAWAEIEHVAAAALNAIAGQRLALYERRGIEHFLDQALFESNITRKTLDAMLGAIADNYELPRRFLRRKAQLHGQGQARLPGCRRSPAPRGRLAGHVGGRAGTHSQRVRDLPASRRLHEDGVRQELGRERSAAGQEPRRLLHELATHQRVAHLHDLQQHPG